MIKSPFINDLIHSHQYQGKTNDCGPFSASIIVSALKKQILLGKSLSKYFDDYPVQLRFPFIYRIPGWATFPWGIAAALKQYGIKSKWNVLMSTKDLKSSLLSYNIIIVLTGSWTPLSGHYRILAAYDADKGWGFVDPAVQENVITWQNDTDFQKAWKAMGRSVITIKTGKKET
jgi:hypothetical protein